jgi:hypothetical protein
MVAGIVAAAGTIVAVVRAVVAAGAVVAVVELSSPLAPSWLSSLPPAVEP